MSNSSRPSPKSKSARRWLLWSCLFLITASASATVGAIAALLVPHPGVSPTENSTAVAERDGTQFGLQYRITRPVNLLVMGIDRVPEAQPGTPEMLAGRSDTMLLVRVEPRKKNLSVLSIPRDTQVNIPDVGIAKINYANEVGGPELAARVVSRTLHEVPVDRYLRFNTNALRELVDLLGGVEVFVPERMEYVDQTQKLTIDLEEGWQTLNGDQAEQFARFRHDGNGDIGRVQRQQALVKAIQQRMTSPSVLPRLPKIIQVMQQYIDTNLSLEEILALANFGLKIENQSDIRMVMLPGRFSGPNEFVASYWLMDPEGRDRVMSQYFGQSAIARDDFLGQEGDRDFDTLRIAVQNATGRPEVAEKVADYLWDQGIRNVYIIQDWPDDLRQTQIIVQQGDLDGAKALKRMLGFGSVEAASVGDINSDLTIRVGDDWLESPSAGLPSATKASAN